MADFRLQIVTQQRTVFDRDVTSLTMPGEEGSFGVMANHQPIIAVLKAGSIDLRIGNDVRRGKIGGGFFEMESNKATLLVDKLEGIDIAASE
jgi:F-type H+-transporting ATPase subunit epsilon